MDTKVTRIKHFGSTVYNEYNEIGRITIQGIGAGRTSTMAPHLVTTRWMMREATPRALKQFRELGGLQIGQAVVGFQSKKPTGIHPIVASAYRRHSSGRS
jgi:hypothetical protein